MNSTSILVFQIITSQVQGEDSWAGWHRQLHAAPVLLLFPCKVQRQNSLDMSKFCVYEGKAKSRRKS